MQANHGEVVLTWPAPSYPFPTGVLRFYAKIGALSGPVRVGNPPSGHGSRLKSSAGLLALMQGACPRRKGVSLWPVLPFLRWRCACRSGADVCVWRRAAMGAENL